MARTGDCHWTRVGELVVAFFGAGPVAGEAWSGLCRVVAGPQTRTLMLASIGPMEVDSAQRSELGAALQVGPKPSVAVVTDEALVRGCFTAMTWQWSAEVKMFAWHKLADAHAYLEPSELDARGLLDLVEGIRREVEGDGCP